MQTVSIKLTYVKLRLADLCRTKLEITLQFKGSGQEKFCKFFANVSSNAVRMWKLNNKNEI